MEQRYIDLEEINSSANNLILKARRSDNGELVLIKESLLQDSARIHNEARLHKQLFPNQEASLVIHNGRPALIRPYIEGKTLFAAIGNSGMSIKVFLEEAVKIVIALKVIHDEGLIHKDINPSNILIDKNGNCRIIDLELSTPLEKDLPELSPLRNIEGNLSYISPEQTGRMNRILDKRSDYYSLGSTFYHMLSGRVPFESEDILEIVHCHLAVQAKPLHEVSEHIPLVLSAMVAKLMEKSAEERYQSLNGLLSDLQSCKEALESKGELSWFEPGTSEKKAQVRVQQKLYGREKDLNELLDSYAKVKNGGNSLVLISGSGGIGKSSLVQELYKPLTEMNGMFLTGIFDPIRTGLPFYPWRQILDSFTNWVLAESEESREHWIKKLAPTMSRVGSYLLDLCPDLALLSHGELASANAKASERRQGLSFAVSEFMEVLASEIPSLIIFIDDWQWSDEGSCSVLQGLLQSKSVKGLSLILSFRDEEAKENNSFSRVLNEMDSYSSNFTKEALKLNALNHDHLCELLEDSLGTTGTHLEELAKIILNESAGNPFSIENLLHNLDSKDIFSFNTSLNSWDWNNANVRKELLKGNLSEFDAVGNLLQFDDGGESIKKASALGVQFQLSVLAGLLGAEAEMVHELLAPAILNGWLSPEDPKYKFIPKFYSNLNQDVSFKFSHARIQQAFYDLWDKAEKGKFHVSIAEALINDELSISDYSDDQLFRIAQQICDGKEFSSHSSKEEEFYSILTSAGLRSYQLAAFDNARTFLKKAEALDSNSFNNSDEAAALNSALVQSSYFTGFKDESEHYHKRALSHFTQSLDRSKIHYAKIQCLLGDANIVSAVDYSRSALKELEVKLPKKANILQIILNSLSVGKMLPEKDIEGISELPDMEDEKSMAAMNVLEVALSPYFLNNLNTYPLLLFNMVKLSLKNGVTESSVIGFGSYGLILAAMLKKPDQGYRIGLQALKLIDRLDARWATPTAYFTHGMFIGHWKEKLYTQIEYADKGVTIGIKSGNMEYAGWNMFLKMALGIPIGYDFSLLLQEGEKALEFQQRNSLETQKCKSLVMVELLRNMAYSSSKRNWEEPSEALQYELTNAIEAKDLSSLFSYDCYKCIYQYATGNIELAWKSALETEKYLKSIVGTFNMTLYSFYLCLSALDMIDLGKGTKLIHKKLKSNLKKLRKNCELNEFAKLSYQKYAELEYKRVIEKSFSREEYENLIKELLDQKLTIFAILASIKYSAIIKDQDPNLSTTWLQNAKELAITIKANQIVLRIEEELGPTIGASSISLDSENHIETSKSLKSVDLDAFTLVKSATALSAEIRLEDLISKLLDIAMENAGAQRGVFILHRDGQSTIEMEMTITNKEKKSKTIDIPLADYPEIAHSVINFSSSTRTEVVLGNAQEEKPFNSDEYVKRSGIKSILCIPVLHKSELSGLIYLENTLGNDVFTPQRTNLIKLLAGQISVSIENAFMYRNLESLVDERTKELAKEKERSDKLLLNILPDEVAEELKESGKARARRYDQVTVFFSDIVGFTSFAEKIEPEELVKELDYCFKAYDRILSRYNIEKIKTIGDSYFCVSGLPVEYEKNAWEVVNFALDIQEWMKNESDKRKGKFFEVRIGVHTGPAVAGVVGEAKFAYDVWGDTVNIGARMEQNSEAGRVNISDSTFSIVKDEFQCSFRGELEAKNKGKLKMYFVEGRQS